MLQRLKRYYQRVRERVYKKPLSLAEKCRLQFGGAVLFSLVLALLIPYFWMNKLTEKPALDAGRSIAHAIYENHFQLKSLGAENRPRLSESGVVLDESNRLVRWIRLDADGSAGIEELLSDTEKDKLETIRKDTVIPDQAWTESDKNTGGWNRYIRLVSVEENCLHCHTGEALPPAFEKNQEIGTRRRTP